MKNILFIVNGWGLGNSTRCDSIIEELFMRGYCIDVLTSGNGLKYFANNVGVANIYKFESFFYGKKRGKLCMWRTLIAFPEFFMKTVTNVGILKRLLRRKFYASLIIDSDYTVFWLKKKIKIPITAINNSDVIIDECKNLSILPLSVRMQYFVEKCDRWFHEKIPDTVISPSIFPRKNYENKIKHVSPLIHRKLNVRQRQYHLKTILMMVSGSLFQMETSFLGRVLIPENIRVDVLGCDGKSDERILYHGKVYGNTRFSFINNADMMIVNGGFSSVSEAVALRKPVIIIPIENHAEQYINALLVEKFGLGLVATVDNVEEKILDMIRRFSEFVNIHEKFNCRFDGAVQAVELIEEDISKFSEKNKYKKGGCYSDYLRR